MSRAISLYVDRVTLSLDSLQELEEDGKALGDRAQTSTEDPLGDESSPSVERRGWR